MVNGVFLKKNEHCHLGTGGVFTGNSSFCTNPALSATHSEIDVLKKKQQKRKITKAWPWIYTSTFNQYETENSLNIVYNQYVFIVYLTYICHIVLY